jgi:hypothetical protein
VLTILLTGGGNPDPLKRAELLLDEGTLESLGLDIASLQDLYQEALEERGRVGATNDAERALQKLLKQIADRVERLKAFR